MRFGAFLSACGLCLAAAVSADEAPASPAPEFSVLTPSMEGQFSFGGSDAMFMPYAGSITGLETNAKSKRFRRFVAAQNYDPTQTIAQRLIEALAEAGFGAVYEPIPRRPAGTVQSLSWSDLPENPKGKLFLDFNIRSICLCAGNAHFGNRPAISVSWRVLGPRQDVVVPSRNMVYVHAPPFQEAKKGGPTESEAPQKGSPYPPVTVSEGCGFASLDEAEKNPLRLWGCFGEAYDVVVERIAIDLARLRPPAAPVTASGDNRS